MKNPATIKDYFMSIMAQLRYGSGLLKFLLVIILLNGPIAIAQVGVHTDFPDPSSAMDITATNKGLLIPRVTLTSDLSNPSPVTSPATGLLVFNFGSNQPLGFYYWNGLQWVSTSGSSSGSDFWSLLGNAGTTVGTNFIGTTDAQDFALYTDESERMRITAAGNIVIGGTAPYGPADLFTVIGKPGLDYAINAYTPGIGVYTESGFSGFYSDGGEYGLIAFIDQDSTAAVYASNSNINGYGIKTGGSGAPPYTLENTSSGLASTGNDGIFTYGIEATGTGIIAIGSAGDTAFMIPDGAGGAFTGYHGTYSRARNPLGTGVIGGGNYGPANTISGGSGGAFTGNSYGIAAWGTQTNSYGGFMTGHHGAYIKATNATAGTGVIGMGNNVSPAVLTTGSGGAFTGNQGVFGKGTDAAGIGIIGIGSNSTGGYPVISNGCGGSFTGYHGMISLGFNASGTGIVGSGNNNGITFLAVGTGGSFSGYHGAFGKGTNATVGTGFIGLGNNGSSYYTYDGGSGRTGSGGAFTGRWAGVAGWGTEPNANTVGVYGRYIGTGSFHGIGVYGYSAPAASYGYGVQGYGNKYGVLGIQGTAGATNYGVYANGNLSCSGTKTFSIDHPLDPENKILKHYCIESPEVLNMYRGNAVLDDNGIAEITLPDYFTAININFSYELTPIGRPAPNLYISQEIDHEGNFSIAGGNPDQKISWVVYAERNDPYLQQRPMERQVEVDKDDSERGKYLIPALYNQPEEKGIFYRPEISNIQNQTIESRESGSLQTVEVKGTEVIIPVSSKIIPANDPAAKGSKK